MKTHLKALIGGGLALAAFLLATKADALSKALGDLSDTTVECGATGDPEEIAPGGILGSAASSMCIVNDSATCVSIGGSTVVSGGGYEIGDGCNGGKTFCADVRRAWCESASGNVTVNVVWGVQ